MDFENLLPIAHSIVERVWILWGFHTTVVVAVLGWLITKRNETFDRYLKILSTIGYSIFYVVVMTTFIKTYLDIQYIVNDLLLAKGTRSFVANGYIEKLLTFNFWGRILLPFSVCSIFLIFILVLIWNDKIWNLLKNGKKAKK